VNLASPATLGLLAGPAGAESFADHRRRLGPLPAAAGLIEKLESAGLRGRGGAGFPVAAKWRAIGSRRGPAPVILANGCEGEPLSRKDRWLMTHRPHLVLDGAFLARQALGAEKVIVAVAEDLGDAPAAMAAALAERSGEERRTARLVAAPARYVSGESSALTNFAGSGLSVPTSVPPRPHERGVDGAPTLVQNVESLAQVALLARGATAPGVLLTIHAQGRGQVLEVATGSPLGAAVEAAGGSLERTCAVLLGGYFGSWVPAAEAWPLPLDAGALKARGLSLGAGVVAALAPEDCLVCETAAILRYLAGESSAQCGPCFFGLRAIATALERIQAGSPEPGELARLRRWAGEVRGRGACHHPDGAVGFLASALAGFGPDFETHRPHHWHGLG
jgi:NADH:ubiquinone oxidoreductase subunit F (NADH-binding)